MGTSTCKRVLDGPITITDLDVAGGCPFEIVIAAGDADAPRWFYLVPASAALSVHATHLPLREEEPLIVAVVDREKGSANAHCAVTWVGEK